MGWNHTGMIMATKRKQPRKRGGNARALPPLPPGFKGDTTESFAAGGGIIGPTVKHEPPIGPERAQKLMDDLAAVREPQPRPTPQVSEAAKAAAAAWAPFLQAADHRVSQSCKNCSFVGAVDGEPACNLSRHYVPFDPDAEIAPYWCRLRQGPVLVTLEEKP